MQNATFIKKEKITPTIRTFWFQPMQKISYQPGQSITITIPDTKHDSRGDRRWFSLSSAPHEKHIAVTTKIQNGTTSSSFKRRLDELQAGDEIQVSSQAMGDFVLPKNTRIPLVFIAGGIGSAPMRGIIAHLQQENDNREIDMFYAAKKQEEFAFIDIFESYCQSLHLYPSTYSRRREKPPRLTAASVAAELTDEKIKHGLFFVSGPEPFVDSISESLRLNGVETHRLVLGHFHNYSAV